MKKFLAMIMALAMVLALVACGGNNTADNSGKSNSSNASDSADDGASAGAFVIGGTGPLTGGAAIYGTAVANAAKIAVDEINALGGIQFELQFEDDAHDAEKAVNAYNTLKDNDMQIFLLVHHNVI